MAKSLILSKGKIAVVDEEDFEYLNQWKWSLHTCGKYEYASRRANNKTIKLHRFMMGASPGELVDHKNGDTLDHRRSNLRICSRSQNNQNASLRSDNRAGLKGVRRKGSRWEAYIQADKKWTHIGYFDTAIDAAKAYDEQAKKHHGEFARINFT